MAGDVFTLFVVITLTAAELQKFFNTTAQPINTNFTCAGRPTGYYADVPSNCRIYYNCDDQGNKFSYLCPEMTAFRQEALICDHAYLVDCQAGARLGKMAHEPSTSSEFTSTTTQPSRWMTGNLFRGFSSEKNSTVRKEVNTGRFHFGTVNSPERSNNSNTVPSWADDRRTQQVSSTERFSGEKFGVYNKFPFGYQTSHVSENWQSDHRQTFSNLPIQARFGTYFDEQIKSKPASPRVRSGEDQLTMNSREQRIESTTSRFPFGYTRTMESHFSFQNSNYPRWDKVGAKSTQTPGRPSTTTPTTPLTSEFPQRDYTASLKPLVPNVLEDDPYYPTETGTTTEIYYTPSEDNNVLPRALTAPNFQPPLVGVYFKVPDVWPDLSTIDDIVDRRKLFYIPRTNNS
ncbi:uncharacterized protein LOC124185316 [Neodiprion fabricii]|uniref:uncharacterized protein LOC124185316 n=1 Tax=Neodiprion fabricii TaxID=2872261 RepID=UPI001ED90DC7|nr:uncharacterized protein LOC124185316 [Neodiprion fabricii]